MARGVFPHKPQAGQCAVAGCPRPLEALGPWCNTHGKRYRINGDPVLKSLSITELKPYMIAAKPLIEAHAPMLRDIAELLSGLPPCHDQRQVYPGMSARDKADRILACIVRQRGLKDATVLILCRVIAAEVCPKSTSSDLYRKTQVGRAPWSLLRTEFHELFGRRVPTRISCQGGRVALAMYQRLEMIWHYPVKDGLRAEILKATATH